MIHRKMKHPHILPISKVATRADKTKFEIIMPYIPMTLIDVVGSVPLSEARARRYFIQLASAVKYIHDKGFVHSDIKLENVLYDDRDDACYLIDFGLAFPYKRDRYVTNSCGSYDYAAPEVWGGLPRIGPEADIWSLGVCLYAMVTAHFPFKLEGTEGPLKLINGELPLIIPSGLSPELRQLLILMLEMNHHSRISIDLVQAHVWLYLASDELIHHGSISYREIIPETTQPFDLTFDISPSEPTFNHRRNPGVLKRLWRRIWKTH